MKDRLTETTEAIELTESHTQNTISVELNKSCNVRYWVLQIEHTTKYRNKLNMSDIDHNLW